MRRQVFNRSRWQLERERCRIADEAPPCNGGAVALRDVIPSIVKKMDERVEISRQDLENEWETLVGPVAAGHTRPGALDRKSLVIFVDSSARISELVRFERVAMLARFQKRFGAENIRNIHFQLDPDKS